MYDISGLAMYLEIRVAQVLDDRDKLTPHTNRVPQLWDNLQ
jgi:hypothetical protein